MLLEERDAFLRGADGHGYAEHSTDTGADEVRVIEIGQRVAHDDGIYMGSLCRTQDSPQITRLLYTLKNDDER